MAIALERLMCDPELRSRMGVRARVMALREFDEKPITQSLRRIYQAMVRECAGAATAPALGAESDVR